MKTRKSRKVERQWLAALAQNGLFKTRWVPLMRSFPHPAREELRNAHASLPTEAPGCLEDRSLLSGVAGLSADPVVLSQRRFNKVGEQIHLGFRLFARDRVISDLRDDLYNNTAMIIPFARVDGQGVSINRILNRMQHDLAAKVPHAIRSARNEVLAVIRADVERGSRPETSSCADCY